MFRKFKLLAVAASAVFLISSVPSHASAKDDCEKGLEQAEKDLSNAALDGPTSSAVQNLLRGARSNQKAGKFKGCVKKVNSAKNKIG
jgi:hypothetical protein